MDVTGVRWRKSSKSGGNGGGCVEIGTDDRTPVVHVRDTTARHRGMLTVTAESWGAFLGEAKSGRLDLPLREGDQPGMPSIHAGLIHIPYQAAGDVWVEHLPSGDVLRIGPWLSPSPA
jgi:Domain of unknown function (DUF397)